MRSINKVTANTGSLYNTGTGATFNVGPLTDTEVVKASQDKISDINSGNVYFLDMFVDGHNSNATGYGFSGNGAIGYSTGVIQDAFSTNNITIGTIVSLKAQNPGQNYTINPFVTILDKTISSSGKRDYILLLSNTNSNFSSSQVLYQQIPVNSTIITVSSNTGAFLLGEGIVQVKNSSSNGMGIVIGTVANNVIVTPINGTTFNTSNTISGVTTGSSANVSTITYQTSNVIAKGLIEYISSSILGVRRTSFNYDFVAGGNVYSVDTNGSNVGFGTIGSIVINSANDNYMGFNANVLSVVKTAAGIVTTVDVISSGFGHLPNAELTLVSSNSQVTDLFGIANVDQQGISEGYWKNNQGKLNSDKYIHDNKYYQEYSYEIQSKLSLQTYSDILKKVLHVSGTELFGKSIIQTEQNISLNTDGVQITETT
jgi:hypothetical protein